MLIRASLRLLPIATRPASSAPSGTSLRLGLRSYPPWPPTKAGSVSNIKPDALASAWATMARVLLSATADPVVRAVVVLDRNGAASTIIASIISSIISVGAINASIVVAEMIRLRAYSHAAHWRINSNLSCRQVPLG